MHHALLTSTCLVVDPAGPLRLAGRVEGAVRDEHEHGSALDVVLRCGTC